MSQYMHRNETKILQSCFLHGLSNPPRSIPLENPTLGPEA